MYFTHTPQIWQAYPQLVAGLLVVDGITPEPDVGSYLEPWFAKARQRLQAGPESQLEEIAAWRRVYSQMGLKPTQYRSAGEALLRRFRREDDLPRLHPLVDICNALSLAFALPVAVFDLDQVDTYLEVGYASGTETYQAFSGDIEQPAPAEVIFVDAARQVHARRWTFRQSRQSTISAQSRRALIVSEGLHATAPTDVPALIDALADQISELWAAPWQRAILSANAPRLDF